MRDILGRPMAVVTRLPVRLAFGQKTVKIIDQLDRCSSTEAYRQEALFGANAAAGGRLVCSTTVSG